VRLRVARADAAGQHWVDFAVSDTGIGMTEEQLRPIDGLRHRGDQRAGGRLDFYRASDHRSWRSWASQSAHGTLRVIDADATPLELIVTHLGGEGLAVETAASFFRHSRESGYPGSTAPPTTSVHPRFGFR
jgi:hypothetical protein